jgi:hypothetical protein
MRSHIGEIVSTIGRPDASVEGYGACATTTRTFGTEPVSAPPASRVRVLDSILVEHWGMSYVEAKQE